MESRKASSGSCTCVCVCVSLRCKKGRERPTKRLSLPISKPSRISRASSLWPTSSNACVPSWPATSSKTSSPPLWSSLACELLPSSDKSCCCQMPSVQWRCLCRKGRSRAEQSRHTGARPRSSTRCTPCHVSPYTDPSWSNAAAHRHM